MDIKIKDLTCKAIKYLTVPVGGFLLYVILAVNGWNVEDFRRDGIRKICNKVGYISPEEVSSFSREHLNKDEIPDYVLHLKDGSRLEFLSKGYELRK